MNISYLIKKILWIDCVGAFATGLAMLFFSGWLSALYGLSAGFVIGHALVHLIYGRLLILASRAKTEANVVAAIADIWKLCVGGFLPCYCGIDLE